MNKEENISEVGVKDWFCFRRKGLKRYMDLYHLSLLHFDLFFSKTEKIGIDDGSDFFLARAFCV